MVKVNDFARELSEKYGLSLSDASDFISAMFDVVKEELDAEDSSVKIKGFGTFKVSAVSARASVDVNTGERIIIDGRNKISFTPEVLLRDRVNRPFVQFETVVLNDGVDFSEIDDENNEETEPVAESEEVVEPEITEQHQQPAPPQQSETLEEQKKLENIEELEHLSPLDHTESPVPTSEEEQPSPTAPTNQSAPHTDTLHDSKVVNTEEHREMARRLMTPKGETMGEPTESADEKHTSIATSNDKSIDASDDEDIIIGGCKQRSPRIMYVLTIVSFFILVSLGIGMYFLYQRIEEKNHVIDRLETRIYAQQDTIIRPIDTKNLVAVANDTVVPKDTVSVTESSKAASTSTSKPASTATTPSDYNYDVRVRTGAYIIVGVAKTVVVQKGQTLASISKAYLGEGMECYVEVLNNCHSVEVGEKLKIPELKLKPRKR